MIGILLILIDYHIEYDYVETIFYSWQEWNEHRDIEINSSAFVLFLECGRCLDMNTEKIQGLIQLVRPELPLAAGICTVTGQIFAAGGLPSFKVGVL